MATDPSRDDPFGQGDGHRTFIRPNPGGWAAAPRSETTQTGAGSDTASLAIPEHGLNPLVALANKLLQLLPQIRQTKHMADPGALRNQLAQSLREFERLAQAKGIAPERVMAARYVLCTVLDEAAADTPWGGGGIWGRHSLLTLFHNEAYGGEKVFQLMARLAENPEANRDLLELIYGAIALGFEGRYRVVDNGRAQLDAVRERLAQIVRQQRGAYSPALAQHWQGHPTQRRRALTWLPLAATAAVAALALAGIYTALALSLSSASDPVLERIQSLRLAPPLAPVAQPALQPRLAQFLQPDIKAGLVAVRDEVDRSVITIRGDGIFPAGSSALVPEREVLMARIAEALARQLGPVLVTGHTDNTPIRTARFPSNWHLSEERARTVAQMLAAGGVAQDRIRAEGRAEGEPMVPNDSPSNRAINRRVEITLAIGRPEPPGIKPAQGAASGAR
jgi:type VI secretion system protein ImpK